MGLLFFAFFGIGAFIYACRCSVDDAKGREQSRREGLDTYFDHQGRCRLVSNNHPVFRSTRRINGSWDDVLVDLQTEQVLYNYSNDKREKERKNTITMHEKNMEDKRKAKEEGRYFYYAYGEPKIVIGFHEDSIVRNSWIHKRRVSDDLLLHPDSDYRSIRDARCGFYLWSKDAELHNDIKRLREFAVRNWWKIKDWEDQRQWWKDKSNPFPTTEEAEEYARNIGAYLPDTIRNGRYLLINEVNQEVLNIIKKNNYNLAEGNINYFVNIIQKELVDNGYLICKDELKNMMRREL